jgi:hypothetical protein
MGFRDGMMERTQEVHHEGPRKMLALLFSGEAMRWQSINQFATSQRLHFHLRSIAALLRQVRPMPLRWKYAKRWSGASGAGKLASWRKDVDVRHPHNRVTLNL